MSEQKTAQRNWHSIVGPNGMCECGVDAAGVVTACGQLHQAELGVSPGDLRARIEQLSLPVDANSTPYPVLLHKDTNSYRAGWCDAIREVLALLGAAQER